MSKPLILVTNDDGINAPGIRNLISVMKEIGDVVVVAPDSPQSGMGHAITINSTLHTSKIPPKNSKTIEYSCSEHQLIALNWLLMNLCLENLIYVYLE